MSAEHDNRSEPATPWSLWPTLGFTLVVGIAFVLVQNLVVWLYGMSYLESHPEIDYQQFVQRLQYDGTFLSYSLIPTAVIGSALVLYFAALRRDYPVRDYLGLHAVHPGRILLWVVLMFVLVSLVDAASFWMERDTMPEFMRRSYTSADNVALYAFAIVVAAPVFEELLFRGFLFQGLRYSRLGNIGAALVVSALWAVVHSQYGAFEISMIFLIGMIFVLSRLYTGSLWTPIVLHMVNNLLAFLQVAGLYPYGVNPPPL